MTITNVPTPPASKRRVIGYGTAAKADQAADAVTKVSLFDGLTRRQRRAAESYFTFVEVPAGTTVWHEGEVGREFCIVVRGQLAVSIDGQPIGVVGRGGHVGEQALLNESDPRRRATVTVMEPAVVAVINRRGFRSLLEDLPGVARQVLATCARREAHIRDHHRVRQPVAA